MKSEITTKIVAIITNIMECSIDINSSRENITTWDSLNQVRLILELNETFDIKIPFDKIGNLDSVTKIIDYVANFRK